MTQIIINENTPLIIEGDTPVVVEVGTPGPQGSSGTATVGTVTTGSAGSAAVVTNSGTPSAAVFNFTIPKGDIGDVTPEATLAKNQAVAAASAAAASETAAEIAEQSAQDFASVALNSAVEASTSADTASTEAAQASTSASNAANSAQSVEAAAITASAKADQAIASAAAALSSANIASASAQDASDYAIIADTKAQEAVVSATTATNKANQASASAASALSSQQITTDNATLSIAQANLASAKAAAASTSEANALVQSSVATAQALTATNQAGIATTQAGVATAQAVISSTQAGVSTSQANISTAQAVISTTKASEASTSASSAAVSASAALASQTASASSASLANTSAGQSAGSAAQVLAIYGTTNAQQAALISAQNAASLAQGYAASASSAVQQDLSGVSAGLHRSPNAVTAMFVYDTSKDSDGGAWTEKCQHTSWYNEALNGKWLGAQPSEQYARNQNATLGAELVTNGTFESDTAWTKGQGWSIDVVNKRAYSSGAFDNAFIEQAIAFTSGKLYRITLDVTNIRNYCDRIYLGGVTVLAGTPYSIASGTLTFYCIAGTAGNLRIGMSGLDWEGYVDNISIREVTALTTASGDYYQLSTDGKFYKLWKNLLSQSNTFTNYNYTAITGTITPNSSTVTAPDGTNTATEIAFAGTGNDLAYRFAAVPAGTTYSVWMRTASGTRTIALRCWSTGAYVTHTVTTAWQRFSFTVSSAESTALGFDNRAPYGASGTAGSIFVATAQLEYGTTATTYEAKGADGSVSETFRGNKADFPRLAGIVAEAASVTIYDLTEAGRPMWMRFIGTTANGGILGGYGYAFSVSSLACLNATLSVPMSLAYNGVSFIDFAKDSARRINDVIYLANPLFRKGVYNSGISNRNNTAFAFENSLTVGIASSLVNAVAMTVLPDSPIDPVTGLQVPTIAVATAGGVSVIKHNGTVVNSASTSTFSGVFIAGTTLSAYRTGDGNFFYAAAIGLLPAGFAIATMPSSNFIQAFNNKIIQAGQTYVKGHTGRAFSLRLNRDSSAKSSAVDITNTFNTGHMVGDIRRAYLADVDVGSVTGTLILSDDFSTYADTAAMQAAGWTDIAPTASVLNSGKIRVTGGASGGVYRNYGIATIIGKTYRVTCDVTVVSAGTWFVIPKSLVAAGGSNLALVSGSASQSVSVTFVATTTAESINMQVTAAGVVDFDNISITEVIADRSYKAAAANITGTLTKSQVASAAAQLVAYSGFSAANYLREPYSADLDFGTGEFTASAWVNTVFPNTNVNLFSYPEDRSHSSWYSVGGNFVVTPNATLDPRGGTNAVLLAPNATNAQHLTFQNVTTAVCPHVTYIEVKPSPGFVDCLRINCFDDLRGDFVFNFPSGVLTRLSRIDDNSIVVTSLPNGWYGIEMPNPNAGGARQCGRVVFRLANGTEIYAGNGVDGVYFARSSLNPGTTKAPFVAGFTTARNPVAPLLSRSFSSGAYVDFGIDGYGLLQANVFDGTTTRAVTTTAAYNTATWLKARVNYRAGRLAILVNGVEVAVTNGAPLLTLNNSNAVLTIGNSFTADAPFPGSLALVKLSATVPTAEQALWMYEQEKQMFRDGAQVTLPDAGSIVDLTYDDATDKWIAVSATNESEWSGLVRTSVTPVSAGSYSRVSAASGVQLLARATTNPGVDINIPAYGLREELVKRSESAARLARNLVSFDYIGGFTANTTLGATSITSAANIVYPVSYIGARVTGSGIPTDTFVDAVIGTTVYLTKTATATATGVQISFTDFILPVGYEAKDVLLAGVSQREGATQAFVRLFDGFKETVRFNTAPIYNALVQIQATRSN